ncbi:MAG: ATPase, T2SS/T4P/T4SS family, partial [Clostridiales bacterium]
MEMMEILKKGVEDKASDVFIIAGSPVCYKLNGHIYSIGENKLNTLDTNVLVKEIYKMADNRATVPVLVDGDDDFSFSIEGLSRFRVSIYKQRGSLAAVIRIVTFGIPDPAAMHIPQNVLDLAESNKGLVLFTGAAGSGKSTTLACIIDLINKNRNAHIITLEDPLEYLHRHNKSLISQREVSSDTQSYSTGLRSALRQSPDVILLGEMRDYETINVVMTAAETGQLIFSTLHTMGVSKTIDRIIDVFPADQQ